MIWEELGFTYIGPIDGHDINGVREALRKQAPGRTGRLIVH